MDWKSFFTLNNIVALILGIVGLIWLIMSVWRNQKIRRINNWPRAQAEIISSQAYPANDAAGQTLVDPENIVATTVSDARYRPQVVYRYTVDNRVYQSDKFRYNDDRTYGPAEIKALMAPLRPGSVIPVFYNKGKPSESYIMNGELNWVGPTIGAILLLLGAWLGWKGFQKFKKTQAASKVTVASTSTYNTRMPDAYDFRTSTPGPYNSGPYLNMR